MKTLRNLILFLVLISGTASLPTWAISYGIYDARSLAMGGASVGAGNSDHAHFYNPALLSFRNTDEDLSRNGRVILPGIVAQYSDAGEAAADIIEDELDRQVSDSVDQFNADPTNLDSAAALLNSLEDFDEAIDALNRQTIEADAYFGLSVSEPANREGGSFYFGVRGLVFGLADVTDEDLTLLDQYVDAVGSLADGSATLADLDPSLLDGAGLADPRPRLTSDARIASLVIREWGLSMSREFEFWGQGISFGATPKIMQVDVYREDVNFVDDVPSYNENVRDYLTMNIDLGIAAELFDNYRVGLAVRDLATRSFTSGNGLDVELQPRTRMGFAYVNDFVTIGLDVDVVENKPVANEPESQELAVGAELSPWRAIDIRLGYRTELAGVREDVLSTGIRYQLARFIIEASVAASSELTGGALQMGWSF